MWKAEFHLEQLYRSSHHVSSGSLRNRRRDLVATPPRTTPAEEPGTDSKDKDPNPEASKLQPITSKIMIARLLEKLQVKTHINRKVLVPLLQAGKIVFFHKQTVMNAYQSDEIPKRYSSFLIVYEKDVNLNVVTDDNYEEYIAYVDLGSAESVNELFENPA